MTPYRSPTFRPDDDALERLLAKARRKTARVEAALFVLRILALAFLFALVTDGLIYVGERGEEARAADRRACLERGGTIVETDDDRQRCIVVLYELPR